MCARCVRQAINETRNDEIVSRGDDLLGVEFDLTVTEAIPSSGAVWPAIVMYGFLRHDVERIINAQSPSLDTVL